MNAAGAVEIVFINLKVTSRQAILHSERTLLAGPHRAQIAIDTLPEQA